MSERRFQSEGLPVDSSTSSAKERKTGFSEEAKQLMLTRMLALKKYIENNDFLSGWPTFASMVELHEDVGSSLLREPEVIQLARELSEELAKKDTPTAQERIFFLKDFIISPYLS